MPITLLFLIISTAFAIPCGPHEIYVREQLIKSCTKNDRTKVVAHSRKSHCRELTRLIYFLDETKQIFKGVKKNIKKWSPEEKKIVEEHLALFTGCTFSKDNNGKNLGNYQRPSGRGKSVCIDFARRPGLLQDATETLLVSSTSAHPQMLLFLEDSADELAPPRGTLVDANLDIFEKVFLVRKTRDLKDLKAYFGKPTEIKPSQGNASSDNYYFSKTDEHPSMDVFVDRNTKKIESFSLTFWGNFDAYPYLKNRFKNYKWIETELPLRTDLDYTEEIHRVEIPELGISFEYDNQDPLRRPMWIFIKGEG